MSLRSRGDTDVSAVAGSFDGGGHRLAAGYTSRAASLDEAVEQLVETLVAVDPATAAP